MPGDKLLKGVDTIFKYQTDLVIYLIDTVSGSVISEENVALIRNKTFLNAIKKDMGFYVLYNTGRENFKLTVCADGYERKEFPVNYERLDSKIPAIYVQMVPKRSLKNDTAIWELKGNISGLTTIDAVSEEDSFLYFKEYRKEEQVLSLFNCREGAYAGRQYAVINPGKTAYAVFEIQQELSGSPLSGKQWKIDGIPEKFCIPNAVIARVVHGIAEQNGDYILRLKAGSDFRKDGKKNIYIIRCIVNGTEKFCCLDWQDENQKSGGIPWERW
ncbi:MAG: hypothetical protein HFI34_11085 [Lachnospiraceae bacterium]|nr:hypothetical protein [Lachnospiraceae bacterium]